MNPTVDNEPPGSAHAPPDESPARTRRAATYRGSDSTASVTADGPRVLEVEASTSSRLFDGVEAVP